MRRKASLILLAFAVFFTALSPLMRWYAFARLAKIPPDEYQTVVLEAKNATLIDYGTMRDKKVSKLSVVQTLSGDVEASNKIEKSAGRDVVVWKALSYIVGPDGKMVSEIPETYIFDAHSQAPVHATGESVDGDPVRREGIEFKWPFLTQKRDYEYFDARARITRPIHYKGTRTFHGLKVYDFEQTIPWTRVPFPKKLPVKGITAASLARTGTQMWYTTVRTFLVDPVTGAPVYGEERHKEEMRGGTLVGDGKKITAFAGDVTMRPDYVKSTVALVKSQRTLVLLLTSYLPWGFLGLGLVLLALSLWLEARGRRPGEPEGAPERAPQPAGV
ncbi:DUF3068 domain-containing protein [Streptomyces beihaiensis]|uniref:DUF3068 domain-containing protein n=1 Tax=Streptomyces beihaiensis TaxID=2984495 RepID=A0ABT3TYI0_9ACTN|nr:DUF3068 domain-containing protein [Streptomyces beihaiensis]MCX3062108.1 DUF3068 domain-containing protein [Streptomyces beihaiensis]